MNYQSLLHPNSQVDVSSLVKRLNALETKDNRYALRGGTKVTYDSTGRIASLYVENADIVSLNASKITAGDISANRMAANVLSALQVNVSSLSAITANIGEITAGSITGVTITGGTLRTASSGQRVEITGSTNSIAFYNANGYDTGLMYGDNTYGIVIAPNMGYWIWLVGGDTHILDGDLLIHTGDALKTGTIAPYIGTDINFNANLICSGWGSFSGDLDMNNHIIKEVKAIEFNQQTSRPSDNDMIYYRNVSGSYSFRSRMEGSNWQFDQTSV